jgi:hypothetical protein
MPTSLSMEKQKRLLKRNNGRREEKFTDVAKEPQN